MNSQLTLLLCWLAVAGTGWFTLRRFSHKLAVADRLLEEDSQAGPPVPDGQRELVRMFRRWLVNAGFSRRSAIGVFIVAESFAFLLGGVTFLFVRLSGVVALGTTQLQELPGQGAQVFPPLLESLPWFLWLLIAISPVLYVRSRNRYRRRLIQEDFPIFLEFLVTLTNAGMGFDEALKRVLTYFAPHRPIPEAFLTFQQEVASGSSRVRGYARIREALPSPEIRSFASALIHSSETGGRISDILKNQAADSLSKRKMRALEWAAGLPVRLLFPMLVCFLPGIWIIGLGPVLYQFLKTVEPTIRSFGG